MRYKIQDSGYNILWEVLQISACVDCFLNPESCCLHPVL
ncbi:hypothetical protein D3OALGA1CA_3514 [Olavius algarvensis associated proteobacterium Delta 3]|nr:hypothetical protein D3OALGA1CA_3514 [Olavius algarvensis associated proteobacterium Delta 3]